MQSEAAKSLIINGSFVTGKNDPGDIDVLLILDESSDTEANAAIDALPFLSTTRLKVPTDISLLSLEQIPQLCPHSISTCAPDGEVTGDRRFQPTHHALGVFACSRARAGAHHYLIRTQITPATPFFTVATEQKEGEAVRKAGILVYNSGSLCPYSTGRNHILFP